MNAKKLTSVFLQSIFFTLLGMCFPFVIHADGTALSLSPSLIRIEAKPPADIWTPFIISNNSTQAITLQVGYKPFDPQASSNGKVVFFNDSQNIPGADQKIFEKMQIVDDQNISRDTIIIGPKQKLHYRLRISLPPNEPTSDYYFSLILLQKSAQVDQNSSKDNNDNQKSSSNLLAGIGLNVLLAVGDKETPQGSIETFSTPLLTKGNSVPFSLSIHNAGLHFINPSGSIAIKNMFGQTIDKITIPASIILSGTSRAYTNTSFQSSPEIGGIVWQNNFLFGFYTATLTIAMSDAGPVYMRTIQFIGFPVLLFCELLITLCILVYIYMRVKRKLS